MPTLHRYVAARFAAAFFGSLLVLTLLVLVVDMLLHVNEVFGEEGGIGQGVALLGLRTLSRYLPYLIPISAFTGTFLAVGGAARNAEILAVKTAGISPLRALLPVFAGAALVAAAGFVVTETVSVWATNALLHLGGEDEDDFYRRSGQIWYNAGRFIYNIRSPDAETERLEEVRVYERDAQGRLLRVVDAARAERVGPGLWRFVDGSVRSFDATLPEAPPGYEAFAETEIELANDRTARRLQGNLAAVPLWTLARYQPSPREQARIGAVVHDRLSAPLTALVFALLALPLALRAERSRNLAAPAAQGVLILFVFLMAREYGTTFAAGGDLPAAAATWVTLALFTGFGLWQLARVER